jgi:hypothetical protein
MGTSEGTFDGCLTIGTLLPAVLLNQLLHVGGVRVLDTLAQMPRLAARAASKFLTLGAGCHLAVHDEGLWNKFRALVAIRSDIGLVLHASLQIAAGYRRGQEVQDLSCGLYLRTPLTACRGSSRAIAPGCFECVLQANLAPSVPARKHSKGRVSLIQFPATCHAYVV